MLSEAGTASSNRVFSNLGLAALEVALIQQKVFEDTLQELAARQEQAKAEQERKAAEERKADDQDSPASSSDHVVDVIVGGGSTSGSETGDGSATTDARGTTVDVAV
ncbi:MAG: hypothetical protein EXQ86_04800 [Rhodospirillales bacterium]|nr:hypothetical protein [Rhodospirillales bacterium]